MKWPKTSSDGKLMCKWFYRQITCSCRGRFSYTRILPFGAENLIKRITRANLIASNLPILKTQVTCQLNQSVISNH